MITECLVAHTHSRGTVHKVMFIATHLTHPIISYYLTFGDAELADAIQGVAARLRANNCSVGELVKLLRRFAPSKWPHAPPRAGVAGVYHEQPS